MASEPITIYMPLLNEGTDCWRPVQATHLGADTYRIEPQHYDREDEAWQFPSGSIVRCHSHTFSGGQTGLAAFELVQPAT